MSDTPPNDPAPIPTPAPTPDPPPQVAPAGPTPPQPSDPNDGLIGRFTEVLSKRDDDLVGRLTAALKPADPPKIVAPEPKTDVPTPSPADAPKGGRFSKWWFK